MGVISKERIRKAYDEVKACRLSVEMAELAHEVASGLGLDAQVVLDVIQEPVPEPNKDPA